MNAMLVWINRAERWVAIFAFLVMVLALMADVASRRIFSTGLIAATEIAVFGMIALAVFGIGLATDAGAHLRPTVFDKVFPAGWNAVVDRLASAVTAGFFLVLTGFSIWIVAESFHIGDRTEILRAPVWALQCALAIGFFTNALRFTAFAADPALKPADRGGADGPRPGPGATAEGSQAKAGEG